MKSYLYILAFICLLSCKKNSSETPQENHLTALSVINTYCVGLDNWDGDPLDWLLQHPQTSPNFKQSLQDIIQAAQKENPEFGLDFDPVLDAQDFPDKGFVLKDYDPSTGYMTLSGVEWPEFLLVVRAVEHENRWYLDGAGVVNIPESKRTVRY